MDWSKDDVDALLDAEQRADKSLEINGERKPSHADVLRAVASRAMELAAARGGTMTAEHIHETREAWLGREGEGDVEDLIDHISALGARNAVLEERLASAVKALDQENGIVAQIQERLSAAEEGNRELVRRAQQAEAHRDSWRDEHGASMRRWKTERESAETWRRRIEAAAEELADVGAGEVGRLDIVSRVRLLKARCATLSAAGQVLSAHVGKGEDDRDLPQREPHTFMPGECREDGVECAYVSPTEKLACGWPQEAHRYPCSATCTHDDAAKPGHPERVKERSEAVKQAAAPDPVGQLALEAGAKPGREIASYRAGYEQGCDDMRAACLEAVMRVVDAEGAGRLADRLKSAIEGAVP